MTGARWGDHLLGPGTHASRPAANTVPDATLYSCTDHSLIYISDRATNAWTTYATLGSPGAILASLFDAKGDLLVATADNTVARLAASTDGYVLTTDSTQAAGVKWAAAAAGGSGSVVRGTAQRTAGDLTISSTTFAPLNGSNASELDITIAASVGDVIAYMPSLLPGSSAPAMSFDVATIVSGSVVNYFSGGLGSGIAGFYRSGGSQQGVAGIATYVVQSGDISSGNVTLRILAAVSSSTRGISASSATAIKVVAMNFSKLA